MTETTGNPDGFEIPAVQPVTPEVQREPGISPELIQGVLNELEKGNDPFAPEEGPVHDTDRPDIPDIDEVIERRRGR